MNRATFNFIQLLRLLQHTEVELTILSPAEAADTRLLPGQPEEHFCTILLPEGGVRHCSTPACVLRLIPTPHELLLRIDGFASAILRLDVEEDLP